MGYDSGMVTVGRTVFCLVVLLGLLAGADVRACQPCFDLPEIPALVEADGGPSVPARLVDVAFNEIAATDDDENPNLKTALIVHRNSSNAFASLGVPVHDAETADEPASRPVRPATASVFPTVPAVSVAALLLIFMLACIALVERRSTAAITSRAPRRPAPPRALR